MTDSRAAQVASWSKNAENWTAAVRSDAIASRREATNAAILAAALAAPLGKTLDVGCGEGWLCRELRNSTQEIVGVDVSPELISRAREEGGATYDVLSYAELCAEPARAGKDFDTIVCNFSLLDDRLEPICDALAAISTPKARLLIQTLHPLAFAPPYEDGWRIESFESFGGEKWAPMPYFARTLGSWIEAISKRWDLKRLLEPKIPSAPIPASLLLVAERR
ncbi:class I SAM-dependent methyltransferase [Methylocystis bryophila]|uniref:SAM-dependent methyltransferase n=1 Tax=Methylocystis bryophila TaxID=655015 RepID=A0A1W6MUS5_9HYPH|nr:class I SAM-dependent methyltransferase [Methylocystis bryophila]ARN81344.1 SAM-dependent methyltransferase [Methylocystis bryophila]BDV37327.1 methyltransferase [Methylocystis bryophila]